MIKIIFDYHMIILKYIWKNKKNIYNIDLNEFISIL